MVTLRNLKLSQCQKGNLLDTEVLKMRDSTVSARLRASWTLSASWPMSVSLALAWESCASKCMHAMSKLPRKIKLRKRLSKNVESNKKQVKVILRSIIHELSQRSLFPRGSRSLSSEKR